MRRRCGSWPVGREGPLAAEGRWVRWKLFVHSDELLAKVVSEVASLEVDLDEWRVKHRLRDRRVVGTSQSWWWPSRSRRSEAR